MVENFIFSLNIVMPVFLVMLIGYFLKKKDFINDNFIQVSNKIIFNIALPIKIFSDVLNTSLEESFDMKFLSFIVIGTIISFTISLAIGLIAIEDRSKLGAFVQGCFRGNFIYVGLSILENITGFITLNASLIVIVSIPLYNILSISVLSLNNNKDNKIDIKNISSSIIKNPLIIATLLGFGINLIGIKLPQTAFRTMGYFRELVTPFALLTIGASFRFDKESKDNLPALIASSLKLVIFPLIAVILAKYLNFDNLDILLIYIYFGVPTAVVSYVLTSAMDGDRELASNIILITTILSVFTTTAFIFIFKTMGMF